MAVDADSAGSELTAAADTGRELEPESTEVSKKSDPERHRDTGSSVVAGILKSEVKLSVIVGFAFALSMAVAVAWLGWRSYQSFKAEQQNELFIRTARQGALNITTVKYTEVDADVKRILDSTTGTFHDDFQSRAEPFMDVVRQSKAETVGSITEAALESVEGDQAQVLVAVSVKTINAGVAEPSPRLWRMRVSVVDVNGDAKVSNIGFVA